MRGEPPSNPIMRFEMNDYMKKFSEKVTNMLAEGSKLGMTLIIFLSFIK